jgi:hypothetical protein
MVEPIKLPTKIPIKKPNILFMMILLLLSQLKPPSPAAALYGHTLRRGRRREQT